MVGPVQESSPTLEQVSKRSAEADPEPSPIAKRHAEEQKPEQQALPLNTTAALEQQPPANESLEDIAQDPAADNQSVSIEVGDGKVAEHPPSSVPSELKTEEVNPTGQVGSDLAAVASKQVAEVTIAITAILEENQKNISEPVAKEATETNPVPPESVKPTGANLSIESQSKDAASQDLAQPTVREGVEVALENAPEAAKLDTNLTSNFEVPFSKSDPVPDTTTTPPLATPTPAKPLPQTTSTPLIGNIPPQAEESLKVAAQEVARMFPLQQVSVRTTPLDLPVEQCIASMEE